MNLKQFKLTNGDELMCEVVDWNAEPHGLMIIRKALKIVSVEDMEDNMRYYTFKPWQVLNTDLEALQLLNPQHIISQGEPGKNATRYFNDVLEEMKEEGTEPELMFYDSDTTNDISAETMDSDYKLH